MADLVQLEIGPGIGSVINEQAAGQVCRFDRLADEFRRDLKIKWGGRKRNVIVNDDGILAVESKSDGGEDDRIIFDKIRVVFCVNGANTAPCCVLAVAIEGVVPNEIGSAECDTISGYVSNCVADDRASIDDPNASSLGRDAVANCAPGNSIGGAR